MPVSCPSCKPPVVPNFTRLDPPPVGYDGAVKCTVCGARIEWKPVRRDRNSIAIATAVIEEEKPQTWRDRPPQL